MIKLTIYTFFSKNRSYTLFRCIVIVLFYLISFYLLSCNNKPISHQSKKPSLEDAVTAYLHSLDTSEYILHQTWVINDTTKAVLSKSKHTYDCHMCGPKLSLSLAVYNKKLREWKVQKTRLNIPIGTSWGKVPDLDFIDNKWGHYLSIDWGYGNQGNEYRIIKIFSLDDAEFGNLKFIYPYTTAIEASADAEILKKYFPEIKHQSNTLSYVYRHSMTFGIDTSNGNIIIQSGDHYMQLHDFNSESERYIKQVTLPKVIDKFLRVGNYWAKSILRK